MSDEVLVRLLVVVGADVVVSTAAAEGADVVRTAAAVGAAVGAGVRRTADAVGLIVIAVGGEVFASSWAWTGTTVPDETRPKTRREAVVVALAR
jgi:hypothetical protein